MPTIFFTDNLEKIFEKYKKKEIPLMYKDELNYYFPDIERSKAIIESMYKIIGLKSEFITTNEYLNRH